LPFLQSEISNLKFEISHAFAFKSALAYGSTFPATPTPGCNPEFTSP